MLVDSGLVTPSLFGLRRTPGMTAASIAISQPSSQPCGDRVAAIGRVRRPAEITGAQLLLGQHAFDRLHDGVRGFGLAQMLEHHRARPDLSDGIGDPLPRDVRRRAMHRLEHRRIDAVRVDVARRRDADGAGASRAEVRENVTEQVRCHHHVELVGAQHEQRRQNVDVILVPLDVGIVLRHRFHALVPVRHGDRDAVGLRRGRQMLLRRLASELKGELQHAIDADTAHHRLLHHDLALGAAEHAAADRGILALGVLAHDPEVDVAGLSSRQRRRHARHQPHRTQVDVLVELAAEQDQRAPQRNVIRDLRRPADRAEVDRVVLADLFLPVVRHHLLMLLVIIVGREVEMILPQLEAEFLRGRLEHAHALRHDLLADAVAGNDGDAIDAVGGGHGFPPSAVRSKTGWGATDR